MSPLQNQVGGDHYRKLKIQPFQFSLCNGWDGAAHSILKYVTRYRDKGGVQDLQKGLHIAEIRMELWGAWLLPPHVKMRMRDYIEANEITGIDAKVLMCLEEWVNDHNRRDSYDAMVNGMHDMIARYMMQTG